MPENLRLMRPTLAVSGTRTVKKTDMVLNGATPKLEVDSETYEVRADGVLLTCEPASVCCRWRSATSCSDAALMRRATKVLPPGGWKTERTDGLGAPVL